MTLSVLAVHLHSHTTNFILMLGQQIKRMAWFPVVYMRFGKRYWLGAGPTSQEPRTPIVQGNDSWFVVKERWSRERTLCNQQDWVLLRNPF